MVTVVKSSVLGWALLDLTLECFCSKRVEKWNKESRRNTTRYKLSEMPLCTLKNVRRKTFFNTTIFFLEKCLLFRLLAKPELPWSKQNVNFTYYNKVWNGKYTPRRSFHVESFFYIFASSLFNGCVYINFERFCKYHLQKKINRICYHIRSNFNAFQIPINFTIWK